MAIQTIDLTVPGGDTPRSANTKINANFTNTTHAASRLVGGKLGDVLTVGVAGLGHQVKQISNVDMAAGTTITSFRGSLGSDVNGLPSGFYYTDNTVTGSLQQKFLMHVSYGGAGIEGFSLATNPNSDVYGFRKWSATGVDNPLRIIRHSGNTTQDANGFLKNASPIAEIYNDKMDLNDDAQAQGGITFEKLGVGDYLVKGSLGFSQDGWYIEMPKDANGNVLVAVIYEQLVNNDISIKTYAKTFDMDTGDIIPNTSRPRDIPTGRFISLRLHELPKEPPVMPTQNTSADAPAQTNNP